VFNSIILVFEILENGIGVATMTWKLNGLVLMDIANGAITFISLRHVHGKSVILVPNVIFLNFYECKLSPWIVFAFLWIISIIE
jgi:hypothetical protein